jgi:hypothetical protein
VLQERTTEGAIIPLTAVVEAHHNMGIMPVERNATEAVPNIQLVTGLNCCHLPLNNLQQISIHQQDQPVLPHPALMHPPIYVWIPTAVP